jgi:hypothetical protein
MLFDMNSSLEGYMAGAFSTEPPAPLGGAPSQVTPAKADPSAIKTSAGLWARIPFDVKLYIGTVIVIVIAIMLLTKFSKKLPVHAAPEFVPWTPVGS